LDDWATVRGKVMSETAEIILAVGVAATWVALGVAVVITVYFDNRR